MRKLFSFLVGIGVGATLGFTLVALFAPITGRDVIANAREQYQRALSAGRQAASERRAELEAELRQRRDARRQREERA